MGYDPRTGDDPAPDWSQSGDKVVSVDVKWLFNWIRKILRR